MSSWLYWWDIYRLYTYKVTKKFSERKQVHVGMEPSKTRQTRWEQHHNTHTIPTACAILPCVGLCAYRRVVEGTGLG